jgi:hypothetical protein
LVSLKKVISKSKDDVSFRVGKLRRKIFTAMKRPKQGSASSFKTPNKHRKTAPPPLVEASPRDSPIRESLRLNQIHPGQLLQQCIPHLSKRRNRKRMIACAVFICINHWRTVATESKTTVIAELNYSRIRKWNIAVLNNKRWKENIADASGKMWSSYVDDNSLLLDNRDVGINLDFGVLGKTNKLKRKAQEFVTNDAVADATGRMWGTYTDENSILLENPDVDFGLGKEKIIRMLDRSKQIKRKAQEAVMDNLKKVTKKIKLSGRKLKEGTEVQSPKSKSQFPLSHSQGMTRQHPKLKQIFSGNRQENPMFFNYKDAQDAWAKMTKRNPKMLDEPDVEAFDLWDVLTSMENQWL